MDSKLSISLLSSFVFAFPSSTTVHEPGHRCPIRIGSETEGSDADAQRVKEHEPAHGGSSDTGEHLDGLGGHHRPGLTDDWPECAADNG